MLSCYYTFDQVLLNLWFVTCQLIDLVGLLWDYSLARSMEWNKPIILSAEKLAEESHLLGES